MIDNFDALKKAMTGVIAHTHPLLRDQALFCAATKDAFVELHNDINNVVQQHINDNVKNGMQLLKRGYKC